MYRITEEHDFSKEWRVTGADPEAQMPGSGGTSESRKGEWGKVLQQNGGIWSVFQFSWTKFDEYLTKKLFDYLIVHTYVDRYFSSSILDIRCFLLTVGKKTQTNINSLRHNTEMFA
jgi:hypothetical protein